MMRLLSAAAIALVVGHAAQPDGAARAALTPHTGHAMTTAGLDGGVFLVGGAVSPGESAWRFTGAEWQSFGAGGPANRNMVAAAFDTRRQILVAFGGVGVRNGSRYGETWEWNGREGEERDVRGPGARDHHALAYDEARGQVVMYGGMNGDHKDLQSDTWTWDGATWTRAEEQSGPGGLSHHAMAYDATRRRVVLYGGITNNGPATGDVWEWDGKTWLRIPPARYLHAMAYDARRQKIVMTAGNRSVRPYDVLADTWEWDGSAWSVVEGQSAPRVAVVAAHGQTDWRWISALMLTL